LQRIKAKVGTKKDHKMNFIENKSGKFLQGMILGCIITQPNKMFENLIIDLEQTIAHFYRP
jgi:hypothetical protein